MLKKVPGVTTLWGRPSLEAMALISLRRPPPISLSWARGVPDLGRFPCLILQVPPHTQEGGVALGHMLLSFVSPRGAVLGSTYPYLRACRFLRQ
jgi:hypothetical protein